MSTQLALDPTVVAHIAAINNFDIDAVMATFAENALVNDVHREFWGQEHIRAWVAKEMVGDHITLEPVEAVDNAGMHVVRCKFDGDYDKTNLPDPLIMTNYFQVDDGKIVTLFVIKNSDPAY
jgi:predicted transcriptional regulator